MPANVATRSAACRIATSTGAHIVPTFASAWVPQRWQLAFDRAADLLTGICLLVVAWFGKVVLAAIVFLVEPSWFEGAAEVRWPEPTFRNFVAVALNVTLSTIAAFAVLIGINYLSSRYFHHRFYLSRDTRVQLSPKTLGVPAPRPF